MATPESELIMFGEAVATPIQNSSSTSNTNTSMSGIETPVPKGHASYEYHQAINHVDACQNTVEENQTLHVTDARVTNVLNADPMVVAQAHHMVCDARSQALQFAFNAEANAREQSLQHIQSVEANANAQALHYAQAAEANARSQAGQRVHEIQSQAQSQVRAIESQASDMVQRTHNEANRLVDQAQREIMGSHEEIQQLKALLMDRSQQMIHMGDRIEAKDRQLAESASLIQSLSDRMNELTQRLHEQDNVVMSIRTEQSRQIAVQPAQGQSSSSRSGPSTRPNPITPSIPISFVKPAPMIQSIATPKSSHPGTEPQGFAVDCTPTLAMPASGCQSGCGALHLAPPHATGLQAEHSPVRRNQEIGMQIQGDQNMALSMQVQQLTQQVHLMMNMMNQNAKGTGFPNVPNPSGNQSPGQNTPPGSSSSSSSSFGRKPRKGGGSPGGGGSPPPSPSPSSKQGAASSPGSSVSSDPYRREKKTMRIKQYDQMKLPPLPADAAKCRSFRNTVFSIICKFAKNDEGEVFKWISLCI